MTKTNHGIEMIKNFRREADSLKNLVKTLEDTVRKELQESPIVKEWKAKYSCDDEKCDITQIHKRNNQPILHNHSTVQGISDPYIVIEGLDQHDLCRPYKIRVGLFFSVSAYYYSDRKLKELRDKYQRELKEIEGMFGFDYCTFVQGSPI